MSSQDFNSVPQEKLKDFKSTPYLDSQAQESLKIYYQWSAFKESNFSEPGQHVAYWYTVEIPFKDTLLLSIFFTGGQISPVAIYLNNKEEQKKAIEYLNQCKVNCCHLTYVGTDDGCTN